MNKIFRKDQKGQGIVIVALLMVALIAILALTIDGGLTYAQRRKAQNAADAGALAGARAMCTTGGGDPVVEARNYASRNGIPDVATNVQVTAQQVGVVRSVVVNVTLPYKTAFTGVIGIDNTKVGAVAEAACYPPCSGSGILPIAWSCSPPVGGSISPDCDVDPPKSKGSCKWGDDPIYIVADSHPVTDDIVCQEPSQPVNPAYVDCDLDDDGFNDVEILSQASRAWLDLDGGVAEQRN